MNGNIYCIIRAYILFDLRCHIFVDMTEDSATVSGLSGRSKYIALCIKNNQKRHHIDMVTSILRHSSYKQIKKNHHTLILL